MEYLVIIMSITGCVIGLIFGIFIGHHNALKRDHKGVLFIDRTNEEPYVTSCWLGIENEKDLKNLREGDYVVFTVHINHVRIG